MVLEDCSLSDAAALAARTSDQVTAMLAYWDKDLICRYANNAFVDWFGKSKEQMINHIRLDELLGQLYEKYIPYIEAALAGKKQLFEREIPMHDGSGVRHSLATYIPDIIDGEVCGFFAHVADVTYIKTLEKKVATAKRETLQKVIETKEAERKHLVEILSESVNQQLAACKILIENEQKKQANVALYENIGLEISKIIKQINLLCQDLVPTGIEMLGLIEAAELHLSAMAGLQQKDIDIVFEDKNIEKLAVKDKYAVFRILQNFISIVFAAADIKHVAVLVICIGHCVRIKFTTDQEIMLNKNSDEYHAIVCRVDYYSGTITEYSIDNRSFVDIEFFVTASNDIPPVKSQHHSLVTGF